MPCVRASCLWLRSLAILLVAGTCLLASGCGGGDSESGRLLSAEQASDLLGTLNQVEQDVTDRDCTGAAEQVATLDSQVDAIARLRRSLRRSLRASVRRLETLVSTACDTGTEAPTETTPTTPEPDTGATGPTGGADEEPPPEEEQPKEKKPKDESKGKGPDGQGPPGQQDEGGGAGLPGESGSSGSGSQP